MPSHAPRPLVTDDTNGVRQNASIGTSNQRKRKLNRRWASKSSAPRSTAHDETATLSMSGRIGIFVNPAFMGRNSQAPRYAARTACLGRNRANSTRLTGSQERMMASAKRMNDCLQLSLRRDAERSAFSPLLTEKALRFASRRNEQLAHRGP